MKDSEKYLLIPLLLLGMMVGCARPPKTLTVLPSYNVPQDWRNRGTFPRETSSPIWWTSLGGPALEPILEEVLQNNLGLKAIQARMEATAALARIEGADRFPQVGVSADALRRKQNFIGLPIPGLGSEPLTTQSTLYGLSLNSSWELDLWGRVRAQTSAAQADYQAGFLDYQAAQISLLAQATKTWLRYLAARQTEKLSLETRESYHRTALKMEDRYDRGLRSALDVRLARNAWKNASALYLEAQAASAQISRQVQLLLGRYPDGLDSWNHSLPVLEQAIPLGLPSELLERRPDLLALERRLAASDRRIWQATANRFPRIALTAAGGTSSNELRDLLDSDFSIWQVAGNITLPLFQGGKIQGGVDLAEARFREHLAQYLSTLLTAYSEVEGALKMEQTFLEQEELFQAATHEAHEALRFAEERYESGLIEFVSVLDAQRRALSGDRDVIEIRLRRLVNRVDLFLALGGGFHQPASGRKGKTVSPDHIFKRNP